MPQLDDIERNRYLGSRLSADAAVDAHAAVPPVTVPAHPAAPATAVPSPTVSLSGEWRMRGAEPAKEFSIERWAESGERKPTTVPPPWWREDTDRSEWIPATVPGTVQAALVAAGRLPEPFWDDNTHRELVEHGEPREWPWHFRRTRVERQEWWLTRRFEAPEDWSGRRVRLAFDGIDYTASVYLNGRMLGTHSGMFGGPEIEVGPLLRFGGENELTVRIFPPPQDWHGVLKGSPGWGWHYGHLISAGIWKDVRLDVVPDLELRHPFVHVASLDDSRAELRVQYDVENATRETREVRVTGTITGGAGAIAFHNKVTLMPGTNRFDTTVVVDAPRVWWPFGYGEQPLYTLDLALDGASVSTEFGIRTIEMAAVPDWDGPEFYRWRFVVNGRPLFLKGANWCWTDPMAREGFEKDAHILDLCVDANLQMLRAWGGGIIESDEFYRACDRRGILVYQEFPLCFGQQESPDVDLRVIEDQVPRVVQRLRNHPSLVMWGGGNENALPVGADEAHELVGRRVLQYDPSRPYHRTDPWGGSEHSYAVYHDGQPVDVGYPAVDTVVFGEYGLSSQCDYDSMLHFLPEERLAQWPPPEHGGILQHQSQFSRFDLFKQLRYADYGPVRDWRTMIEYSQLAQGDALRFASERMRSRSGEHTSAYWFYKVGEVFPGASWAVIDYYGVPKLSYYRAKQFGRARSAFAVTDRLEWAAGERFHAEVHVANDTPQPLDGARVRVTMWDAALAAVAEWTRAVSVAADGRECVLDVDAPAPPGAFLLAVRLEDADGALVSDQWYAFNAHPKSDAIREWEAKPIDSLWSHPAEELLAPYADLEEAPLLEMPRTRLRARIKGDAIEIVNDGTQPAFTVLIDGFPHELGNRLDDNAFSLWPGETRRIPFVAPADALSPVRVRAWNADSVVPV